MPPVSYLKSAVLSFARVVRGLSCLITKSSQTGLASSWLRPLAPSRLSVLGLVVIFFFLAAQKEWTTIVSMWSYDMRTNSLTILDSLRVVVCELLRNDTREMILGSFEIWELWFLLYLLWYWCDRKQYRLVRSYGALKKLELCYDYKLSLFSIDTLKNCLSGLRCSRFRIRVRFGLDNGYGLICFRWKHEHKKNFLQGRLRCYTRRET